MSVANDSMDIEARGRDARERFDLGSVVECSAGRDVRIPACARRETALRNGLPNVERLQRVIAQGRQAIVREPPSPGIRSDVMKRPVHDHGDGTHDAKRYRNARLDRAAIHAATSCSSGLWVLGSRSTKCATAVSTRPETNDGVSVRKSWSVVSESQSARTPAICATKRLFVAVMGDSFPIVPRC